MAHDEDASDVDVEGESWGLSAERLYGEVATVCASASSGGRSGIFDGGDGGRGIAAQSSRSIVENKRLAVGGRGESWQIGQDNWVRVFLRVK